MAGARARRRPADVGAADRRRRAAAGRRAARARRAVDRAGPRAPAAARRAARASPTRPCACSRPGTAACRRARCRCPTNARLVEWVSYSRTMPALRRRRLPRRPRHARARARLRLRRRRLPGRRRHERERRAPGLGRRGRARAAALRHAARRCGWRSSGRWASRRSAAASSRARSIDAVERPMRTSSRALAAAALVRASWRPGAARSSGGGTRTHNLSVNSRAALPLSYPGSGYPGSSAGSPHSRRARPCIETRAPASTSAWQLEHRSTHLLRLRPQPARASVRRPRVAQREPLLAGSTWWNCSARSAAVVAAEPAAAAGLLDEDRLDLAPAPATTASDRHFAAAIAARRVEHERRSRRAAHSCSVHRRPASSRSIASRGRPRPTASSARTRAASGAPSPCCGRRRRRSARSTCPASTSGSSSLAPARPSRACRSRCAACSPCLLDPVGDRRFVPPQLAARSPPATGPRSSSCSSDGAIHAPHCPARAWDDNGLRHTALSHGARAPRAAAGYPSLSPVSSSTRPYARSNSA